MKNSNVKTELRNESIDVSRDKARDYVAPKLTVYGSVRELTRGGNTGTVSDGQSGMTMVGQSDVRTKENIVRIGEHAFGFGIFLFDFKSEFQSVGGYGRQFGVLAHEVESIMPEAVSVGDNGYKRVNYAMLGIVPNKTVH